MASREVDKRTLHVLLEAVRASSERLQDFYHHAHRHHQEPPETFRRQYAGVRRLREYLKRCADACTVAAQVDLAESDENLLAACLVDNLPEIDDKLSAPGTKRHERPWLESQRTLLMRIARELMTVPLQVILNVNQRGRFTPSVSLMRRAAPGTRADAAEGGSADPAGVTATPTGDQPVPAASPAAATETSGKWSMDMARPEPAPPPRSPEPAADTEAVPSLLFDANMVRDHHVRAQVRMDLRDLAWAQQRNDLRMSLVHLSSLLEGILLDYGLLHRDELGLSRKPDEWDFRDLGLRLLAAEIPPGREVVLGVLIACHRLLRPSCQFAQPMAITAVMVKEATTMLKWVLAQLGYEGTGLRAPPPSVLGDPALPSTAWRVSPRSAG